MPSTGPVRSRRGLAQPVGRCLDGVREVRQRLELAIEKDEGARGVARACASGTTTTERLERGIEIEEGEIIEEVEGGATHQHHTVSSIANIRVNEQQRVESSGNSGVESTWGGDQHQTASSIANGQMSEQQRMASSVESGGRADQHRIASSITNSLVSEQQRTESSGDENIAEETPVGSDVQTAATCGGIPATELPEIVAIVQTAIALFPEAASGNLYERICSAASEAYKQASEHYTEWDANQWAENFIMPPDVAEGDAALLRSHGGDLAKAAKARQEQLAHNRLSKWRVEEGISVANPDYERMMGLAVDGMIVDLDPEYVPHAVDQWPRLSGTYQRVSHAVDRLFYESFVQRGLAFILPKEVVRTLRPQVVLGNADWAEKAGKAQGRPLTNAKRSVNSEFTKQAVNDRCGAIQLPTIAEIAVLPLLFFDKQKAVDPSYTWEQITAYKMDLNAAFQLLSIRPADVRFLAVELVAGLVLIFLCGIFGWTSTPAYFQVVSRSLVWQLRLVVLGLLVMYVDDIIGFCSAQDVQTELGIIQGVAETILGEGAVAPKKTMWGRRIPVIGYIIDLDSKLLTIDSKNVNRAIYGFLSVRLDAPITLRMMQRLASWGSRYANVCVFMRPFVRALYRGYAGRSGLATFPIPVDAARSIRMFRVLLLLVVVDERRFARQLDTFRVMEARWIAEFDASLTGIGIIIYQCVRMGAVITEVPVGYCAVDISVLGFKGLPQFQNTAEFIGGTLAVRAARLCNAEMDSIQLRGDSMSALTWAGKQKFRSTLVAPASVVFVAQYVELGVDINGFTHLDAASNWKTDALSRDGSLQSIVKKGAVGFTEELYNIPIEAEAIVGLCKPDYPVDTDVEFVAFWTAARAAVHI